MTSREVPCGGSPATVPVCSTPLGNTPEGLCDMAGNLLEWVADWFRADYYCSSPDTDPPGPASSNVDSRSLRSAAWWNIAPDLRTSDRGSAGPTFADPLVGLRCARSVSP
jgi:formylglycine-generating enzyme required for sulfatase activity